MAYSPAQVIGGKPGMGARGESALRTHSRLDKHCVGGMCQWLSFFLFFASPTRQGDVLKVGTISYSSSALTHL